MYIYRFEAMTTPCELLIKTSNKKKADRVAKRILQNSKLLEKKYNFFNPNSYLSKINNRETNILDKEFLHLLELSKKYYYLTNKVFDVTIGTIKDVFLYSTTIDELQENKNRLKEFMGFENIKIKNQKIIFLNRYIKLDFGGLVKEYAVDSAVKILKEFKIKSALVNFGGDIYAYGKKSNNQRYKIGIKDPKNPKNIAAFVELEDEAIATSASYERGYTIDNKRFSHIISKDGKYSANSVSVISKSCVDSGVFATALMIDNTIKCKNRVLIF